MKKTKQHRSTKKIKTTWNFALLYRSDTDPRIEADIRLLESRYDTFAQKYAGRTDYIQDEHLLAEALGDYENLDKDFAPHKPLLYFNFQHDTNSADPKIEARLNDLSQRYDKIANTIVFFGVTLSKISADNQKKFLTSPILAPYRYFLSTVFSKAKHTLSESEEKVLNLKSLPAHTLWVRGNEKLLAGRTVEWKGKKVALSEASARIGLLPTKDRRALQAIVNTTLKSVSDMAESEINAVVIDKKINDELRGYSKPYSATILNYQNDEATILNLIETVSKHVSISHRFYDLKARMLGQKKLMYADRSASVGATSLKISFEKAVDITRSAFGDFGEVYKKTFEEFLENGQIDAFPRSGKRSGAYCWTGRRMPSFVLLNYVSNLSSLTTLAHEMGHAFHSKFSQENQPSLYKSYTTATAEVASTFFENLVFEKVFETLSPRDQVIALHDKINGSVSGIFRQVACFNFELDLHNQIREKGSLSKEQIAELMNKHMKTYLGKTLELKSDDGYFFVQWSHIRRFFYVYTYAFGEIVSNALFALYKKDKNFEKQIRQFLSAGGSDSPENIFAKIGIDVRNPEFFKQGLMQIKQDVDRLEKLLESKKK